MDRTPDLLNQRQTCYHLSQRGELILQNLNVVMLVYSLTFRHPLNHNNTPNVKKGQLALPSVLTCSSLLFFILGDVGDFQCIDCLFFWGSYWKIHVSSHVMTFSSKLGFCMISCRMSVQLFFQLSFWSWVRFFGTNFSQTFRILSPLCKICCTVSLLIPTMSAIILTCRHQSLRTFSLIFWMFWSVFKVEGRPGCSLSSTPSRPSLNDLWHSNTHERDIKLSPIHIL